MRALDVAGLWTRREARVMDMISLNLAKIRPRVEVPTSIPGLVTKRVLVMKFLDGVPMTQLAKFTSGLSVAKQKAAFKRVRCAASTAATQLCRCSNFCQTGTTCAPERVSRRCK
jgi:ABC1 atypical kinase-like domain